ncbi:unnamed protein product [Arabidopsis halleri]
MQCRAQNAEPESNLLRSQLEHLKLKFDECLQEKTEVDKKLSSFTSEATSSSDNRVLVKHLQEELKRYITKNPDASTMISSVTYPGKQQPR